MFDDMFFNRMMFDQSIQCISFSVGMYFYDMHKVSSVSVFLHGYAYQGVLPQKKKKTHF